MKPAPRTILCLGENAQSDLAEKLFSLGFIPLFRSKMLKALHTLRHEEFKAIFIDYKNVKADVLEFILNVRDIDQNIPVFVIGKSPNRFENQAIALQKNTYLLQTESQQLQAVVNQLREYETYRNP